jgi:hypothetical protein
MRGCALAQATARSNMRRSSLACAIVVGCIVVVATPGTARAQEAFRGIGQAVGLAAGGVTAIVVAPIAGGVAAASDSREVPFFPATGVAFGAGVLGALGGVGLAALDSKGGVADVALPPVMAGAFAIGGALTYWMLSPPAPTRAGASSRLRIVPSGPGISCTF